MYKIFFGWLCLLWVIHRCGFTGEKPRLSQRQSFIQETTLSLLQGRLHTELQGKKWGTASITNHYAQPDFPNIWTRTKQTNKHPKTTMTSLGNKRSLPLLKTNSPLSSFLDGTRIFWEQNTNSSLFLSKKHSFISVSLSEQTTTASKFLKDKYYESFSRHLSCHF